MLVVFTFSQKAFGAMRYISTWRFKILEKSVFTCFSLKTMDFDVKHLKLLKPLVFGKAIGCPGCVLRSEG